MKVFILLTSLVIPIIMIISGALIWKNPPAPNGAVGYRTKRSRSSEKVWYIAQSFWGKLSLFTNIPMMIVTALFMVLCIRNGMNNDDLVNVMVTFVIIQTIMIFAEIAITENKLRKITGD